VKTGEDHIEGWEYYLMLGCAISLITFIDEWNQASQCSSVILISIKYDSMDKTTPSKVTYIMVAVQFATLVAIVLYDTKIGTIVIAGFIATDTIYIKVICFVKAFLVSMSTKYDKDVQVQ